MTYLAHSKEGFPEEQWQTIQDHAEGVAELCVRFSALWCDEAYARGPVQINFGKSVDPVLPQEITITRQAVTTESDKANKETEMGKKNFIPYGLYRAEGYVSAMLAQKTGFSEDDLEKLWTAILQMFEHDHSAARGKMCMRKLIVFRHASLLGNAPSAELFDKVTIRRQDGVEVARSWKDYIVDIDRNMPEGVELLEKL